MVTSRLILIDLLFIFAYSANSQDLRFLGQNSEPTIIETGTTEPKNCTHSEWSDWTEHLPCNDDCGSCGRRTEKRECNTPDCPCSGPSRRETPCNIQVCEYPRPACCPPFNLTMVDQHFACGPQEENVQTLFRKAINSKLSETQVEKQGIGQIKINAPTSPTSRNPNSHTDSAMKNRISL